MSSNEAKTKFSMLSETVNALVISGTIDPDVYQRTREDLIRYAGHLSVNETAGNVTTSSSSRSGEVTRVAAAVVTSTVANAVAIKEKVQWEYRGRDGNIHGPFDSSAMASWRSAGYFVGDQVVDVRMIERKEKNSHDPSFLSSNQKKKGSENNVMDLLGDLEDSDGDDNNKDHDAANEKENNSNLKVAMVVGGTWMRSDAVNFGEYL